MGNSPPRYQLSDLHFRLRWQAALRDAIFYDPRFDSGNGMTKEMKAICALPQYEIDERCVVVSVIISRLYPRVEPGDVDTLEDTSILVNELLDEGVDASMVAFVNRAHRQAFVLGNNVRLEVEDKIAEEKHEMIKLTNKKKNPGEDFTAWISKTLGKINKEKNMGHHRVADVYVLWRYRRYTSFTDKNVSIEDFVAYLQYYGYKLVEVDGKLLIDRYRIRW